MPAKLDQSKIVPLICERLVAGDSLRTICADEGFPCRSTLHEWMESDENLRAAIARARNLGFDERAEAAVEKAQSAKDPALARLAFDAERWYLSKLNPQRYGERIQTAQTDTEGNDVAPSDPVAALHNILGSAAARRANDTSDLA